MKKMNNIFFICILLLFGTGIISCTMDTNSSSLTILTITDIPEKYNGGYFAISWGFSINEYGNSEDFIFSKESKVNNGKSTVKVLDVDTEQEVVCSGIFYISSAYIYKGNTGEERAWGEVEFVNGIGTISWNDGEKIYVNY